MYLTLIRVFAGQNAFLELEDGTHSIATLVINGFPQKSSAQHLSSSGNVVYPVVLLLAARGAMWAARGCARFPGER